MLENKMKETHVRDFVSYADDDASGTVDYAELFGVFIRELGIDISMKEVNDYLDSQFNQNGDKKFTPKDLDD